MHADYGTAASDSPTNRWDPTERNPRVAADARSRRSICTPAPAVISIRFSVYHRAPRRQHATCWQVSDGDLRRFVVALRAPGKAGMEGRAGSALHRRAAIDGGPAQGAGVRERVDEALAGGTSAAVLSREIATQFGVATLPREAEGHVVGRVSASRGAWGEPRGGKRVMDDRGKSEGSEGFAKPPKRAVNAAEAVVEGRGPGQGEWRAELSAVWIPTGLLSHGAFADGSGWGDGDPGPALRGGSCGRPLLPAGRSRSRVPWGGMSAALI